MADNNLTVPPQSIQAEQSVIGGLLIDGDAFHKVQSVINAQDFYRPDHKILFNAVAQLHAENSAVDAVTVVDYLTGKGTLDRAGGINAIRELCRSTPSAANIVAHANIIKEKSLRRQIIKTCDEMRGLAFTENGLSAKQIIEQAETQIFALHQQGIMNKSGFELIRNTLAAVVDQMDADFTNPPEDGVTGLTTGFNDLDNKLLGLQPGNFIVVAGRPSMGKTTIAMNIAAHAASVKSVPVAVFSMEMPREDLAQRLIASEGGISLNHVRQSWKIQEHEWALTTAALHKIGPAPLYIDDTPALSFNAVRSRCMRLTAEIANEHPDGIGLIVVDYIQLMNSESHGFENRNGQIEEITRGLKALSKELAAPVIALSQLNRNLEQRTNKRPVMSDLRDSGAIEQDADIILFPYRDEVYNSESVEKGTAEVIIGKNRNGPLGTVRLAFEGEFVRFRNLSGYGYSGDYD